MNHVPSSATPSVARKVDNHHAITANDRSPSAALMRLIVLVALELVLFQDVLSEIVLFPPITMIVLAFNLGLFFLVVRPRSLETSDHRDDLGGVVGLLRRCGIPL